MDFFSRFFGSFLPRLDGPLHFRFIFQPLMAITFAVIDGIKDAKMGRPAYLWAMVKKPDQRRELMMLGWKRIGKIFILAIILDVIYQIKVYHWWYPGETLTVAFLLAIVPFLLVRGPVNRLVSWRRRKMTHEIQVRNRA